MVQFWDLIIFNWLHKYSARDIQYLGIGGMGIGVILYLLSLVGVSAEILESIGVILFFTGAFFFVLSSLYIVLGKFFVKDLPKDQRDYEEHRRKSSTTDVATERDKKIDEVYSE